MILISDIYAPGVILSCIHEKYTTRMPLFSIFSGEDELGMG